MRCGYGLVGIISTIGGFFTYFMILTEAGFCIGMLVMLRSDWDDASNNNLVDSYGQEWVRRQERHCF